MLEKNREDRMPHLSSLSLSRHLPSTIAIALPKPKPTLALKTMFALSFLDPGMVWQEEKWGGVVGEAAFEIA
jgi:hypothetical protein